MNDERLAFYAADSATVEGQAIINQTIAEVSGLPLQDWVNSDSAAMDLLEDLGQPYKLHKWLAHSDMPVNYEVIIGYPKHKQAQWTDLKRPSAFAKAYLVWMLIAVEPD